MLSREEECDLVRRWQENGDERAMQRLVEFHIPLATRMAHRFKGYNLPIDDLVQEGVIGLTDALKRFDLAQGFRFSTMARWYVYAAMQEYVLRNFGVVRHGTTAKAKRAFFKGDRQFHASLDVILPSGETWVETLEDDRPSPEQIVEKMIDEERLWKDIRRSLRKLPPRSRDIIRRRFLNRNVETLDTIAIRYGITRERVRQIEQRALLDMRIALAARAAA